MCYNTVTNVIVVFGLIWCFCGSLSRDVVELIKMVKFWCYNCIWQTNSIIACLYVCNLLLWAIFSTICCQFVCMCQLRMKLIPCYFVFVICLMWNCNLWWIFNERFRWSWVDTVSHICVKVKATDTDAITLWTTSCHLIDFFD